MKLTNIEKNLIKDAILKSLDEEYCQGARCSVCPYFVETPIDDKYNCMILAASMRASKLRKENE